MCSFIELYSIYISLVLLKVLTHEAGAGGAGGVGGVGLPGHMYGGPAGPSAHSIEPVALSVSYVTMVSFDKEGCRKRRSHLLEEIWTRR